MTLSKVYIDTFPPLFLFRLSGGGIETATVDAAEARPGRAVCSSILSCSEPRGGQIVCPGPRLHWLVALVQSTGAAGTAGWIDLHHPLLPLPINASTILLFYARCRLQDCRTCVQTLVSPLSPLAWFVLLGQSGWLSCLRGTVSRAQQVFIESRNEVAAKLSPPDLCEQQVLPGPTGVGGRFLLIVFLSLGWLTRLSRVDLVSFGQLLARLFLSVWG